MVAHALFINTLEVSSCARCCGKSTSTLLLAALDTCKWCEVTCSALTILPFLSQHNACTAAQPPNMPACNQNVCGVDTLTRPSTTSRRPCCMPLPRTQGHGDSVEAIGWSPDGRGLVTACADLQLRIWDIHDLSNKNPQFRWVKVPAQPLGVGFGNSLSSVVVALRGERRWEELLVVRGFL